MYQLKGTNTVKTISLPIMTGHIALQNSLCSLAVSPCSASVPQLFQASLQPLGPASSFTYSLKSQMSDVKWLNASWKMEKMKFKMSNAK